MALHGRGVYERNKDTEGEAPSLPSLDFLDIVSGDVCSWLQGCDAKGQEGDSQGKAGHAK